MIEFHSVSFNYPESPKTLDDVNLYVEKGEFVFLVGTTGSGKSTILKMIYRELVPTSGDIYVNDRDITAMRRSEVPLFRRTIGVVFQDFRLISYKSVYENVAYALEVTGASSKFINKRVPEVLEVVGLSDKKDRLPSQLSGGEQQRVSIARAVVNSPVILVADEPTGNLDPDSSWDIMERLEGINKNGTTILMATHNRDIVDYMKKRVILISSGKICIDQEEGCYYPLNSFEKESGGAK